MGYWRFLSSHPFLGLWMVMDHDSALENVWSVLDLNITTTNSLIDFTNYCIAMDHSKELESQTQPMPPVNLEQLVEDASCMWLDESTYPDLGWVWHKSSSLPTLPPYKTSSLEGSLVEWPACIISIVTLWKCQRVKVWTIFLPPFCDAKTNESTNGGVGRVWLFRCRWLLSLRWPWLESTSLAIGHALMGSTGHQKAIHHKRGIPQMGSVLAVVLFLCNRTDDDVAMMSIFFSLVYVFNWNSFCERRNHRKSLLDDDCWWTCFAKNSMLV